MIYRVCECDQVIGLGTCLSRTSCKGDASRSCNQLSNCMSPKRAMKVCAPCTARKAYVCSAQSAKKKPSAGVLHHLTGRGGYFVFPAARIARCDGFQRCKYSTEDCYIRGDSELALSWFFVFPVASFRHIGSARWIDMLVRHLGSARWIDMSVRHLGPASRFDKTRPATENRGNCSPSVSVWL